MKKKVSVPGYVKDYAMLSPSKSGKIDRSYIRSMCSAIAAYEKHRNDNMKKFNKDTTNE